MATTCLIIGESGHGKTTSIRNLNPEETFIINSDRKSLTFKGWKKMYSDDNNNYLPSSDIKEIVDIIKLINRDEKYKHIKSLIIDTVNGIMVDDEMRRMKEKSYDKWADLAASVYNVITNLNILRNDLKVFVMGHMETIMDDFGNYSERLLTSGRKLQKIKLESKFPIVLYCRSEHEGGKSSYYFETQSKNNTAKSPLGMFKSFKIPNDLKIVVDAIEKYEED